MSPTPTVVAAASLRHRADAIRREAIVRHRVGAVDAVLVDELTARLVEAVLAPVLAALDTADASRQQLADAVFELFELRPALNVAAACSTELEGS